MAFPASILGPLPYLKIGSGSAIPLLGLRPIGGLQGLDEFLQGWFILNQLQQTAEGTPGLVRHNVFLQLIKLSVWRHRQLQCASGRPRLLAIRARRPFLKFLSSSREAPKLLPAADSPINPPLLFLGATSGPNFKTCNLSSYSLFALSSFRFPAGGRSGRRGPPGWGTPAPGPPR